MKSSGFTLAELLIALAILGVIATFTIPKVLQSQQDGKWKSGAKEAIASYIGALEQYKLKQPLTSSTRLKDVLDAGHINYVKLYTDTYDGRQTEAGGTCAAGNCILLHNGAMLYGINNTLGGTGTTNAFSFYYDPVAGDSGTTDTGKSVQFFIYSTGLVRTRGSILPNTVSWAFTYAAPSATFDPPWFGWD